MLEMFKYWADQIKKYEMGGVCGTCGGVVSCIEGFGRETWRKETIWKILTWMGGWYSHKFSRNSMGYVDCIDLAQDRNQWWAVVEKVMNLHVP